MTSEFREVLLLSVGFLVFVFLWGFFGFEWAVLVLVLVLAAWMFNWRNKLFPHRTRHDREALEYERRYLDTRHHRETPNYERRYRRLGLAILLSPLYVPLLLMMVSGLFAPPPAQSDARVIEMPKPTDCGLFSGCHYERRVLRFTDKRGEHIVIEWQRVNDW